MKKGIVVAGPLILDQHYEVETYPKKGQLAVVSSSFEELGGTGNVLGSLSKIDPDLPLVSAGYLGDDHAGHFIRNQVASQFPNVSLDGVIVQGSSAYTIIIDAMDDKERTFLTSNGTAGGIEDSTLEWNRLDGDIFLLEYLLLGMEIDQRDEEYGTKAARILHHAQKLGMRTSVDLVSRPSLQAKRICRDSFAYVDICAINEIEVQAASSVTFLKTGKVDEKALKEALLSLKEMGVSSWVITHTPSCCYALDVKESRFWKMRTLDLPQGYIKGKTGAGDAFLAGVLYAAWKRLSLGEGLKAGIATSSASLAGANGTDAVLPYSKALGLFDLYGERSVLEEF